MRKTFTHKNLITFAVFSATLLLSTQSIAAKIGLGLGSAVEYGGSDKNQIIPLASFELETPYGILKNNQVGAQFDLIVSESVDTGPILRANFGRNDTVSDDAVAGLPEIEASAEAGWFLGSGFPVSLLGLNSSAIVIGDVAAVTDVGDGHGGTYIKGSVGLVMLLTDDLRLIPSFTVNYADDNYTHSFYGVDAENATAELGAFEAGAGIESTQVALVAIRTINDKWSVTGIAAYNTLQGDAADSPITERGSDKNVFAGATLSYTF